MPTLDLQRFTEYAETAKELADEAALATWLITREEYTGLQIGNADNPATDRLSYFHVLRSTQEATGHRPPSGEDVGYYEKPRSGPSERVWGAQAALTRFDEELSAVAGCSLLLQMPVLRLELRQYPARIVITSPSEPSDGSR